MERVNYSPEEDSQSEPKTNELDDDKGITNKCSKKTEFDNKLKNQFNSYTQKKWYTINELKRDFSDNINQSEVFKHLKVFSTDKNVQGAKMYFAYSSIEEYWKKLDINNFSRNNDHEFFSSNLTHCVYTGIFFDVDCSVPENMDYNIWKGSIQGKVIIFSKELEKIINEIISSNDKIYTKTIIQSSCLEEERKISYHVLVKNSVLVFGNLYQIKSVLLEGIFRVYKNYDKKFFDIPKSNEDCGEKNDIENNEISKTKETGGDAMEIEKMDQYQKKWLDFQIYRNNGSIRCLYNTKKSNPKRPFVIEKSRPLKSDLLDSFVFLPFKWIQTNNQNPFYTLKVILNTQASAIVKQYNCKWFIQQFESANVSFLELMAPIPDSKVLKYISSFDSISHMIYNTVKKFDRACMNIPTYKGKFCSKNDFAISNAIEINKMPTNSPIFVQNGIDKKNYLEFLEKESIKFMRLVFYSLITYCFIKGSNHKKNHVYYIVDPINMKWWQGCYDEECIFKTKQVKTHGKGGSVKFDIPQEYYTDVIHSRTLITKEIVYSGKMQDQSEQMLNLTFHHEDETQGFSNLNINSLESESSKEQNDKDDFGKELDDIFG
jgi:hypothetical protein